MEVISYAALLAMIASSLTFNSVAKDACPYPAYVQYNCNDGNTCHRQGVITQCSGPTSDSKCQNGPVKVDCCGVDIYYAWQTGLAAVMEGLTQQLLMSL